MGAKLIVQMDGKLTRLQKPKRQSMMGGGEDGGNTPGREANNDFTYDHSYWSFAEADRQFVTQEQVYQDLGSDVINCAFQGTYMLIVLTVNNVCVQFDARASFDFIRFDARCQSAVKYTTFY